MPEAVHTDVCPTHPSDKTTAIHSLLVQAHMLAQVTAVRCYMVDVKRELGAARGRSPLLQEPVQHDVTGAAEVIADLVRGMVGVLAPHSRFEELAHRRKVICESLRDDERHHPDGAHARPPLVFVVVDKLNVLLELARKRDDVHRNLTVLLQTGAGAGFYVIAGAQYLTAKTLGRDATQQFVSRAHFGAPDPIALRMLFNQAPQPIATTFVPPDTATLDDCFRLTRLLGLAPDSYVIGFLEIVSPLDLSVDAVNTVEGRAGSNTDIEVQRVDRKLLHQ